MWKSIFIGCGQLALLVVALVGVTIYVGGETDAGGVLIGVALIALIWSLGRG